MRKLGDKMEGRKELLRKGETVKLKSGKRGWLNQENQTLQLEDRTALPLSESTKSELFPSEKNVKRIEAKEKVRRDVNKNPFGEFLHQATSSGVFGSGIDWFQRLAAQTSDEYLNKRNARQEISQEISQEKSQQIRQINKSYIFEPIFKEELWLRRPMLICLSPHSPRQHRGILPRSVKRDRPPMP